ncbi:hypothetical protein EJ07DRAFT_158963 [Lizonia empirigonia]|nr:hypothetical protein EJ07DRAFT_158963 [Lizonia empirigonia]
MITESPPAAVLETFGSPKAVLNFLNFAIENPRLRAQVDFFLTCWKLTTTVHQSSKITTSLKRLLEEDKKSVEFDDEQLWDLKLRRLKEKIDNDKRSTAASGLRAYIEEVNTIGRAYGEETKQRFAKLSEPVKSLRTPLSHLKVVVEFIKGEPHHTEQASSLEQPTQHRIAASLGSNRASEQCMGPSNKRGNVVGSILSVQEALQCNGKRQNGGKRPGRKRVCLGSEQLDTRGANVSMLPKHAISMPISRPDGELHMPTSPEQSSGVETPAPIGPHSTIHSPMSGPLAHLSPKLEYLGQTSCTEPSDCCLVYSWPAYSAVRFLLDEKTPLWTDGNIYEGRILLPSLERLPNGSLVESVRRSETWKKQSQGYKSLVCFKICLPTSPTMSTEPMGTIFCTVPRNEAPEMYEKD